MATALAFPRGMERARMATPALSRGSTHAGKQKQRLAHTSL
jgi:hypothetical protein